MSEHVDHRAALCARLGYRFTDPALLELALSHRSARTDSDRRSNERLEFLGDAVLQLVVTDALYHARPTDTEGELAPRRVRVVAATALAAAAGRIRLGAELRLSPAEDSAGGREKASILADALEAIIGAAYLDGGLAAAGAVVRTVLSHELARSADDEVPVDDKSRLQQICLIRANEVPVYGHTATGPDHDRTFSATVSVAGRVVGRGTGRSRKAAELAAAAMALSGAPVQSPRDEAGPDGG